MSLDVEWYALEGRFQLVLEQLIFEDFSLSVVELLLFKVVLEAYVVAVECHDLLVELFDSAPHRRHLVPYLLFEIGVLVLNGVVQHFEFLKQIFLSLFAFFLLPPLSIFMVRKTLLIELELLWYRIYFIWVFIL